MSKKKTTVCEIKQIGEEKDRTLRIVGSDETIDRDGDRILVSGWNTDEFNKNPVFLWSHDPYSRPPIGKAVNVQKDTIRKQLVFDIKFPTIEELSSNIDNPSEHAKFCDCVYRMYKSGFLNAVSVGFSPIKYKTRDDADVLDKPEWQRGREYIEQSLLELSACSIPSNPNALALARSSGVIDDVEMKMLQFDEPEQPTEPTIEQNIDPNQSDETKSSDIVLDEANEMLRIRKGDMVTNITYDMLKSIDIAMLNEYNEFVKSGASLSAKNKKALEQIHTEIEGCRDRLRKFVDDNSVVPEDEPCAMDEIMVNDPAKRDVEPEEAKEITGTLLESTFDMKTYMDEMKAELKQFITDLVKSPEPDTISGTTNEADDTISETLNDTIPESDEIDIDSIETPSETNEPEPTNTEDEIDLDNIELPKPDTNAENIELDIEPEQLKEIIRSTICEEISKAKGGNI